jgi:hypothetical protein
MSTPQPEVPKYYPDKIKVQLFKKYTVEYTDVYGKKKTITKTATISKNETVLERENLSRWVQFNEGIFPTSVDTEYANSVYFDKAPNFKSAVVNVIESLLVAMQEDQYISGDLKLATKAIMEGLGGKFNYNEYKANDAREQRYKTIREKVTKELADKAKTPEGKKGSK